MSLGIDAERLRVDALDALGPHGDPRARDALTWGVIGVKPDVTRWVASHGTVRAHQVSLGLSAEQLANVVLAPVVRDALVAAVASAIARDRSESLAELVLVWAQPGPRGYRDPPARALEIDAETLRAALLDFVRASDQPQLADVLARTQVRWPPSRRGRVDIVVGSREDARMLASPSAAALLDVALGALVSASAAIVREGR